MNQLERFGKAAQTTIIVAVWVLFMIAAFALAITGINKLFCSGDLSRS